MAISGSLNFLSASLIGSENIKVDFVGINTLVHDPITGSSNQLGYGSEIDSATYLNENFMKPTATITVADGDADNGMTEKEYINIISSDGTSKRYVITNATHDSDTATGTVLSDADNTDTGTGTAGADEDGGIAVSMVLSAVSQNDFLVALKAAIEHANGHNGKITVSSVPSEADGNQSITLTQTPAGPNSRATITTDISQLTITQFAFQDDLDPNTEPNQLNSLLLHRNGPYQHPMWKQYRGGDHPVARALRLHNTMSIDSSFPDPKRREAAKQLERTKQEDQTYREYDSDLRLQRNPIVSGSNDTGLYAYPGLKQYYEPPVTRKYKPLIYDMPDEDGGGSIRVRMSYMNQMVFFENSALNRDLKIIGTHGEILAREEGTRDLGKLGYKSSGQQYHGFLRAAKDLGANTFVYSQTIFPKSINTFRSFKLEKPDYEEVSGYDSNGYDRAENRTFWKDSQPSLASGISSDGTSRSRTAGAAVSSQEVTQSMIFSSSWGVYAAGDSMTTKASLLEGSRLLISPSGSGDRWNFTYYFIQNGIIAHSAINTTTGTHDARLGTANFCPLESYNPYPITLLSSWPLDPRPDIYDKPVYLTSSIGGEGLQIGLTPHRMKEFKKGADDGSYLDALTSSVSSYFTASLTSSGFDFQNLYGSTGLDWMVAQQFGMRGLVEIPTFPVKKLTAFNVAEAATASYAQFKNLMTGNAGELVYSTKPTIFFSKNLFHTPNNLKADPWRNELESQTGAENGAAIGTITITSYSDIDADDYIKLQKADESYLTYTAKASPSGQYQFKVETSNVTTAYNLANKINSGTFTADATQGIVSIRHPTSVIGTLGETVIDASGADNWDNTDASTGFYAGGEHTNFRLEGEPLLGYATPTASMQYNRHTFPYNTPFWATHKIRNRNPFFDSYSDFSVDSKYLAKGYSALPEYRVAENLEYYLLNYFKGKTDDELYKESVVHPNNKKINMESVIFGNSDLTYKRRILRNVKLSHPAVAPRVTKLNFLKLEGGSPTRGSEESFSETAPSVTGYEFDQMFLTASSKNFDEETVNWKQDSTSLAFHEKFSHTDDITEIASLLDEPFAEGNKVIPSKIEFTVHALKKVLPYKNFYPVTKTVSIGNKFKKFIYEFIGDPISAKKNDSDKEIGLQAFLEPFFAPGILFNSLKSGIAVDHPYYVNPPHYFAPITFKYSGSLTHQLPKGGGANNQWQFGGSGMSDHGYQDDPRVQGSAIDHHSGSNTNDMFSEHISSSFNYGGFYMMGASRSIPAILNRLVDKRMPFEALYNPRDFLERFSRAERLFLTTDFLDLDQADIRDWGHYSTAVEDGQVVGKGFAGEWEPYGEAQIYVHPGSSPTGRHVFDHPLNNPETRLEHTYGADYYGTSSFVSAPFGYGLKPEFGMRPPSIDEILYKFSINNFLCETMNFFLDDVDQPGVKMPIIASQKKNDQDIALAGFDSNLTYYMEVSLKMGLDHVSCEGPRNAGITTPDTRSRPITPGQASMRGYIYGPPIEVVHMSGNITKKATFDGRTTRTDAVIASWRAAGTGPQIAAIFAADPAGPYRSSHAGKGDYDSYFSTNLQDPAYQAYTPPYFYGKSSKILTFSPPDEAIAYTTDDVMKGIKTNSFYFESWITGSLNKHLCKTLPSQDSISMQRNSRMKIDSSIDIDVDPIRIRTRGEGSVQDPSFVWYIAPKWVCPVLDFSSSYAAILNTYEDQDKEEKTYYKVINNSYHDHTTGKGLWGGYGTDPYDHAAMSAISRNEGDGRVSKYEKGIILSISTPYANVTDEKSLGSVADFGVRDAGHSSDFSNAATLLSTQSGSLGEKIGFLRSSTHSKEYKIGKIAEEKTISEAVVIIPYLEKPILIQPAQGVSVEELFATREIIPGRHFLPIHKTLFENILSVHLAEKKNSFVGGDPIAKLIEQSKYIGFENQDSYDAATKTDVYDLIKKISGDEINNKLGYELPPEFDFVHYNIRPFQMIIVPIDHTLKKQELIDIYQNIMPDSSLKIETEKNSIVITPNAPLSGFYDWMPVALEGPGRGQSLSALSPQNFLSSAFTHEFNNPDSNLVNLMHPGRSINQGWLSNSREFYSNLKFMVFKVKQRGIKDYSNYRKRQIEKIVKTQVFANISDPQEINNTIVDFNVPTVVSDIFGYNWPYDDFSLIEAVKIDIKIEVD